MASLGDSNAVYSSVKDYYGKVLESSRDLKTSACTAGAAPHAIVRKIIKTIPDAVNDKFYGCGNPIPLGIEGKDVLDLGSGSGRDCYVAAALVGPQGSVTGVDMTDEQLQTARENINAFGTTLGYTPKLKFVTGYIEMLESSGIAHSSIDVCISNCVINLSPNKKLVLQGVFNALRSGGELYFSDVYADQQLPSAVRTHDVLLGECIGGALFTEEFEQMAVDIGFARPRVLSVGHIAINDAELQGLVGEAKFYSITYRLFKVPQADQSMDGFVAEYQGGIEGYEGEYELDVDHVFVTGKPVQVDAATAAVLSSAWLAGFFKVSAAQTTDGLQPAASTTSTELLMEQAYKASSSNDDSSSCCAPKKESLGCCPPKKEASGCCAPKEASSCCAPKKETSGCCPPKKESSSCCAKKESSGCCNTKTSTTDAQPKLNMLSCSNDTC
ncbi:hypothetical protein IW147_002984 [Coemansia sp. RSA 720]|nr:hypothetical protein IW147_002984 [Coemansia sp. RSA 720]